MSILIWILIGLLVYSFIVVPVFMELALDRPKKTEDGRLRVRGSGFVIRLFYRNNAVREKKYIRVPQNTCQLYKGIYGGILGFCLICPISYFLFAFFLVLIYGISGPAFIMGFWPNHVNWFKRNEPPFYSYEERGRDKKWIAPWKFILPMGLVAIIYFFYKEIFTGLVKISHPLSSNTAVFVYSSIVGLVFLVFIINKTRKTESFVAMKETIVSFIKKLCKGIEIT